MKRIHLLTLFITICSFIVLPKNIIAALPTTLSSIRQVGGVEKDNCGYNSCYGAALKVSSENIAVICTEFSKPSPAEGMATCTMNSDWSEQIRYGVAAIIEKSKSNINTSAFTKEYLVAELAISEFLNEKGAGGSEIHPLGLSSGYKATFDEYLSAANKAYDGFSSNSTVSINLSSTNLTFTLSGANYVSNSVTVSGINNYNVTTTLGTINKSENSFTVTIPASKVSSQTSVTVTVSASKTLNQARRYDCGGSYQKVTIPQLETITKTGEKKISGSIAPKAKLIIEKVDGNNKALSGATIKVVGPNSYSHQFVSSGSSVTIDNLEYGTYTISEIIAPSGYIIAKDVKVTLSETNISQTVTIKNEKIKTKISKTDITGQKELPGATLEIQDTNGKIIKYCRDSRGNENSECKWISTGTPYEIEGIPAGKYYLVETVAPKGYEINKTRVSFTVKNDGTVNMVQMKDELIKLKIYKLDASTKKALKGAVLEIQDTNGKVVKYCRDSKGNENSECRWTTTEEPYEIEGIPAGNYYLVEVSAPEGYVLFKEKIPFTVKDDGTINKVEINNQMTKVKVTKYDVTGKKELPGATLEIQDGEGNIVNYCTDENGNSNKECKWVSTDKSYEIEGLPAGTYYLVEVSAPKGYVLKTEKVPFVVKDDGTITEVSMTNELEVEVPDTMSSRAATLLAIAMLDIAIGIGIITYVKKNKIEQ